MTGKLLLAAVLAAAVYGCGSRKPEAERMLASVERKYAAVFAHVTRADDRQFQTALSAVREIVRRHPEWPGSADIQFAVASLLFERTDYAAAETEYVRVCTDFPQQYELCGRSLFMVGRTRELRNDWTGALNAFSEAFERYPLSSGGLRAPLYIVDHYRAAKLNDEFGRAVESAVWDYLDVIALNPADPVAVTALDYLVTVYSRQDRWREAHDALLRVAQKQSGLPCAPYALVRAAMLSASRLNDPKRAVETLERLRKEYPKSAPAREAPFQACAILAAAGEFDRVRQLIAANEGDRSLAAALNYTFAEALAKRGLAGESLREHETLAARYPGTVPAMRSEILLAEQYRKQDRSPEADRMLEAAVASGAKIVKDRSASPEDRVAAYEFTAMAWYLRGKYPEALRELKTLRKKFPRERAAASALYQMGDIYRRHLGDARKARRCFQELVKQFPDHRFAPAAQQALREMKAASAPRP